MSVVRDLQLARKMKKAGFQNSLRTIWEARDAGLPLSYACAFLEIESEKGQNLFGSDDVRNPVHGGKVTKERYLRYRSYRDHGLGCQGVGPCQLTAKELQQEADRMGGCWIVKYNLRVGFRFAANLIHRFGKKQGVVHYNGSGKAAEDYERMWAEKQAHWHKYLG